jgi:ABC-2 type transport system permease protein
MKFLSIALKDLKELIRDKRGLIFILFFPLLLIVVFGFAFGGIGQSNQQYNLAIVNYDEPATLPTSNETTNYGNDLTQLLKDVTYKGNNSAHMFNVTTRGENEADSLLKNRKIDAVLIIPANFSRSVLALINNTIQTTSNPLSPVNTSPVTSTLIIRGDTGYINFGASQGILVGVLSEYEDQLVINTQNAVKGTPGASQAQYISYDVQPMAGTKNFTNFDFLAPGIMVFAILMLATTVAANLTREVEQGTLARLKLSKMTGFDLLFGGMLPWSLIVVAQVLILFIVAVAVGFHWQGGLNSIVLAIFAGIIGGIASIALGMIIAAFAQNDRQASNLGILVTVPISFVVGAFFQLPNLVIWGFQFNDFLPWTHTLNALRATLIYGGGWDAISSQIAASALLTVILFIIGLILFNKSRLSVDK